MAIRAAVGGTGNFTTAATWGLVDESSTTGTSYLNSEAATTTLGTNYSDTVGTAFLYAVTAPTIDGIGIKISNRTGTTGTLKVHLEVATVEVAGTEVTIDMADLPVIATADINGGWIFFKFASPVALAAATSYNVAAKTSTASMCNLYSLTGDNISHYLRTTTTGAPAAGNDLIITGEYVDQSTNTAVIVTMDEIATTDYGSAPTAANSLITTGIAICQNGTLTYDTTSAHNPLLKISNSIIVYSGGTLSIGTTGTPIPRDSTAVLTFDCGANVDYGLIVRNLGTFNSQGLSRTIGKTFVSTLATTADVTQKTSSAISATAASPGVFTWASNTLSNGDTIQFSNIRTITGISTFTTYYIVNAGTDGAGKFRLSLTKGGGDINTTGAGSSTLVGWATSDVDIAVADDTGWLDNDVVAIASTTRTYTDCEQCVLNGNAAAALLTFDDAMVYGHSATSPTQAEIILLTRNVKIYGASATLQAYIDIKATATVDCDWTEFYWLGSATANKRGIDIATTTGTCTFSYCSRHTSTVASSYGWNMTGASGTGLTIQYCVSYNVANFNFQNVATTGTFTLDNNIFMKNIDASVNMVSMSDIGGTFTNNTTVGATAAGIYIAEVNGIIGTFSGNISHSNLTYGFYFVSAIFNSTISNTTAWRNSSFGIIFGSNPFDNVVFDTVTLFGNTTSNIGGPANAYHNNIKFISLTSNGDTTFSTTNGFAFLGSSSTWTDIYFINCDLSTVSGIKTAHTNDFLTGTQYGVMKIYLINTKLGAATEVSAQTYLMSTSFISSQRHDTTKGAHKTWMKNSTNTIDTIYNTATPSLRITPTSVAVSPYKAVSAPDGRGFKVNVADGQTCTPSVYVRLSKDISQSGTANVAVVTDATSLDDSRLAMTVNAYVGEIVTCNSKTLLVTSNTATKFTGASWTGGTPASGLAWTMGDVYTYTGNVPRLILKRNDAMGYSADQVLDSHSGATGTWEQVTGAVTGAATDDGVLEFIVDCDYGTANSFINVDDFTATVA
jgi:hypothetical protein